MIKKTVKLCLLVSILSLQASSHLFAMDAEENKNYDISAIGVVQSRFAHYQNRVRILEEENKSLKESKTELKKNLKEADEVLSYVLEEATPSLVSYLRALSKDDSKNLEELKKEASQEITFPDLITQVNKQIRGSTPVSIRKLVALHGDKIRISDDLPSVSYSRATIPSTPTKVIDSTEEAILKSVTRRKAEVIPIKGDLEDKSPEKTNVKLKIEEDDDLFGLEDKSPVKTNIKLKIEENNDLIGPQAFPTQKPDVDTGNKEPKGTPEGN